MKSPRLFHVIYPRVFALIKRFEYSFRFGNEDAIGKSTSSDLAEGKYTQLIKHFTEAASESEIQLFQKYFGMEPPFKIHIQDVSYLISLQIFQAALFFSIFWLIVKKRREKAILIAFFTSILLFFLAEFSPKLIHAFSFHYLSSFYLKVSIATGLLTYLICGLFLGKLFTQKNDNITL